MKSYRGALITDLDGTLRNKHKEISSIALSQLRLLGSLNVLRVLATGRSLFSLRKVISNDFPVDYVAFSSGAGIYNWPEQKLEFESSLDSIAVKTILSELLKKDLDFMIHAPIPDNHHFWQRQSGRNNVDFVKRSELYKDFRRPWPVDSTFASASQFLIVEPAEAESTFASLRSNLAPFSVIRATSPLDLRSRWIEVFPQNISKAHAAQWLMEKCGISPQNVVAIGNDYNDFDLLSWASRSYMVGEDAERLCDEISNKKVKCTPDFDALIQNIHKLF